MKICGFSFVRNAIKFSYPVIESIQSVLPLCDKFIISVGNSEDGTLELIKSIPSNKIEVIQTIWDDSLRKNGEVLAQETNKVFDHIPEEYDYAFYIQADEVVHESYLDSIRETLEKWLDNPRVEGFLFNYKHFFGSYNYFADSRGFYRNEIRIVRNNKKIRSFKDAQGFRINGRKLKVKKLDAYIYHYGWVRHPRVMQQKHMNFNKFYHTDKFIYNKINHTQIYDYSKIDSISRFTDSHPTVMEERIKTLNWDIELDENKKSFRYQDRILHLIEKYTGKRLFEYKNYQII